MCVCVLQHPVTWQPSADQRRLIGHMVLHREHGCRGDLGLKVIGGRRTDSGRLGAFITRVKRGSVADTVGRLRTGIDRKLTSSSQSVQKLRRRSAGMERYSAAKCNK